MDKQSRHGSSNTTQPRTSIKQSATLIASIPVLQKAVGLRYPPLHATLKLASHVYVDDGAMVQGMAQSVPQWQVMQTTFSSASHVYAVVADVAGQGLAQFAPQWQVAHATEAVHAMV